MYLPTLEDIEIIEIFEINEETNISFIDRSCLMTKRDSMNKRHKFSGYIPDNIKWFKLYWNLYTGISDISLRLVLIKRYGLDEVCPIEMIKGYY